MRQTRFSPSCALRPATGFVWLPVTLCRLTILTGYNELLQAHTEPMGHFCPGSLHHNSSAPAWNYQVDLPIHGFRICAFTDWLHLPVAPRSEPVALLGSSVDTQGMAKSPGCPTHAFPAQTKQDASHSAPLQQQVSLCGLFRATVFSFVLFVGGFGVGNGPQAQC